MVVCFEEIVIIAMSRAILVAILAPKNLNKTEKKKFLESTRLVQHEYARMPLASVQVS